MLITGLIGPTFDKVRQRIELAPMLPGEHETILGVLNPCLNQFLRLRAVDDADLWIGVEKGPR